MVGRGWVVAGLDNANPAVLNSGTFCKSFVLSNILHLTPRNSFTFQKVIRISCSSRRPGILLLISEFDLKRLGSLPIKTTSFCNAFLLWFVF
jgi:hypothetical protein